MKVAQINKFPHSFIFFFVSILTVLIVSIYSFMLLFETTSQNQLLSYGQIALDSDVLYIDTITNSIQDVFDSISFDPETSKLLNYESIQARELHLGLQRLESYVESNFFIDSIYIYNQKNDTVYVASPNAKEAVYSPVEFYDEGAIQLMQNYSEYRNMQPLFRAIDINYPYEATSSYISFMRYNTLKQANQSNVVMINIKQDILSKLISSVPENNERLLLFTDRTGWYVEVAGNYANYSEDIVETILSHLEEKEKSFAIRIQNRKYIVCFQNVMNSDIHIVLIANESDISGITQTKEYNYALLTLALLFAVCIIAGTSVIKRIFMMNRIHKETLATLEQEKQEMSYEKKRRQILSFLHNDPSKEMSETDMEDLYQSLGIQGDDFPKVLLVLFSINSYYSKVALQYERIKDRSVLKQNICMAVQERMPQSQVLCATYDDDEKCFLLIKGDEMEDAIIENLKAASDSIVTRFGVTASIFVSSASDFSKLSAAYAELCEDLPYRTLYEPGSIITPDMIDAREMYSCSVPETLSRHISESILQLDMGTALLDLKEIIEIISRGSYKSFQLNLLQLAIALDDILSKLQINNGIEKTIHIDTLLYNLSSFETLDSIYKAFEDAILHSEQVVIQNKNSHQANVITEMQAIIKTSFSAKDFSIITVSEKIGMNASYLGKLFKRNTGMTFIEFLHKERMDAACNLLATTNMQIVEIVADVGFSDVPYFYKVFKKANGCTPIKYRQQHQNPLDSL